MYKTWAKLQDGVPPPPHTHTHTHIHTPHFLRKKGGLFEKFVYRPSTTDGTSPTSLKYRIEGKLQHVTFIPEITVHQYTFAIDLHAS